MSAVFPYEIVQDVSQLDVKPEELDSIVFVGGSTKYEEGLVFHSLHQSRFVNKYSRFLSRYSILSELSLLLEFCRILTGDGYRVIFSYNALPVLKKVEDYYRPLRVDNYQVPNDGELFPFQSYALNKALALTSKKKPEERFFFFNAGTGTGKSVMATAGAQELFNRGQVDLVLAFTMQKLSINLARFYESTTSLRTVVVQGTRPRRQKIYASGEYDVFVLNYEKCNFDFEEISELVKGKRVLWILDEVQSVLQSESGPSLKRKAFNKLVKLSKSTVWAMTASAVSQTPWKYHDVFSLPAGLQKNILGNKSGFMKEYLKYSYQKEFRGRYGVFSKTFYVWDLEKLEEVRHRVAPHTHVVRKYDPGVGENFKGLQTVIVPIQLSKEDRKVYNFFHEEARSALSRGELDAVRELVRLSRLVCNTTEALGKTNSRLLEDCEDEGLLNTNAFSTKTSSKAQYLVEQLESMQEAQEKVVVFTQFTNLTLFMLEEKLKKAGIHYVLHHGGMSNKEAQAAQDKFRKDPSITCFLSSDAGAYGLNLPEARFVINYEPTYSFDTMMQRSDRINRADSYLEGLTSYVYLAEDTIEERIWQTNEKRRKLAETVQGSVEHRETLDLSDYENLLSK